MRSLLIAVLVLIPVFIQPSAQASTTIKMYQGTEDGTLTFLQSYTSEDAAARAADKARLEERVVICKYGDSENYSICPTRLSHRGSGRSLTAFFTPPDDAPAPRRAAGGATRLS